MKIDILTIFPEFISSLFNYSIIKKALKNNIFDLNIYDIRDFSKNKHKKVDDYPYGGGHGMLMTIQPIVDAIEKYSNNNTKKIYLSPQGKKLDQNILSRLSQEEHLLLLCGHYEGIDNRIIDNYIDEEISIGDYVLTGGEIPAMVLVDGITRLIPGCLSQSESYEKESHYEKLLEHPQYTRPQIFNGYEVPDILLSGDHKKIEKWNKFQSLIITYLKRPDILDSLELSNEEKEIINKYIKNKEGGQ